LIVDIKIIFSVTTNFVLMWVSMLCAPLKVWQVTILSLMEGEVAVGRANFNPRTLMLVPPVAVLITYSAFGMSLCAYKRCWIRFSWNIVSKNWIQQLHTLMLLHFNRCLTAA
jgi:hypothetical protein